MAETWEVIVWVIVAVALVIIGLVIIASIYACKRRNQREKNSRRKGLEWGKSDETDFAKKKVEYNVKSGVAKILDEPDSGPRPSQENKVQYNANSGEVKILNATDTDTQASEPPVIKNNVTGTQTETSDSFDSRERYKRSDFSFEEKLRSNRKDVRKIEGGKDSVPEVQTKLPQWQKKERLQPVEFVPTQNAPKTRSVVNSYTNLGYRRPAIHGGCHVPPVLQFQQPAAIVRAIVHPGSRGRYGKTRSLPRNYSKLNYKKFSSLTAPRHKPVSYTWSLETQKSDDAQSWITVPIRYRTETKHPMRRRKIVKLTSSDINYPPVRENVESRRFTTRGCTEDVALQNNLSRWRYNQTIPHRRSRRRLERSSMRKQERVNHLIDSRGSPVINDVFITDSRPSYEHRTERTNYYGHSLHPEARYYERSSIHRNQDKVKPESDVAHHTSSYGPSGVSTSEQRNASDYYKENYRMVKRSEFSGKQPIGTKEKFEPDIVSISGSEFSDYLRGPPRPSDSQSEEREDLERSTAKDEHAKSSYSSGSFKQYSGRLQKMSKGTGGDERMEDVHTKHAASFQDTLKNLKNGNNQEHYQANREMITGESVHSPWLNNDNNFRKTHGVPISGVPVLPPGPVFIQTEDTDDSDYEHRKNNRKG